MDWVPGFLTFAPAAILFLPLAAAVLLLAGGRRLDRSADQVSIGALALAFLLSVSLIAVNACAGGRDGGGWREAQAKPFIASWDWIRLGGAALPVGLLVDNLSSCMSAVVTGLGMLVLVYSIFYMRGDAYYRRYFMYMDFFCFAMLGVVFSPNLLMTFVFWELVGLGSYFIIGFWFARPPAALDHHYQERKAKDATGIDERFLSPAYAQKKALVMNRIGDFGFLAGMLVLLYVMLSTATPANGRANSPLDFGMLYAARAAGAFDQASLWGLSGEGLLALAGILVFMGAIGKSAQFPLHTWLPDAMQGPTTGSSIIHAATMVAAGVYLTARLHPLLNDGSLFFVAMIGALTAFLGAGMAMAQWDLKAVLAYSTISQLGYMMLGLGAGAYTAGVAHLFTHAVFKCMLFLCAGSVILACHHLQDLNRLGGLRRRLPLTYLAALAGVLAITGVPGFSGFYSKDAVLAGALARALERGGLDWLPFLLGAVTAPLTAVYMFRFLFLIFHGRPRDYSVYSQAREAPAVAVAPLLILAVGCLGFWWSGRLLGGELFAVPGLTVSAGGQESGWLNAWMTSPAAGSAPEAGHAAAHWGAMLLSLLALAAGWYSARRCYLTADWKPDEMLVRHPRTLGTAYELASQLWYFDRLYQDGVVPLVKGVSGFLFRFDLHFLDRRLVDEWGNLARAVSMLARGLDNWFVDQCVDAFGWLTWLAGAAARLLQSGRIQYYVAVSFGVAALVILWLVWW
jgi:NADH-quinone oxidoreductase subunit L